MQNIRVSFCSAHSQSERDEEFSEKKQETNMVGLDSIVEMERETKLNLISKTKVYVFWDIENVRPQKNSNVLSVVGNVRNRLPATTWKLDSLLSVMLEKRRRNSGSAE